MKEYLKQRWFEYTFSAILVCMAAIVISVFFGYSFSTNDDAMLRSLVEGSYTGTPEAHLIYIMYPLGYIGKILYRLLPAIPWYDIFMVGMHYISWILVLGRIGEQVQTKKNKVLLILPVFASNPLVALSTTSNLLSLLIISHITLLISAESSTTNIFFFISTST